ncbi:MAG: hypothetical protein A2493_02075 [Candidatus Magasanikbacteria bacterium RIFOXYC12_FULL_33_11]|uniref:Cell envelope-related transcriptional attenuator domain-containing protein n=1 Tax=Candidatus Magasanikbacteria bacterium RIFOXYC12_FULL_33_11 TaxID=1798701 RepID=A0A1F6NP59_9BACT|nr:MAG: hypothetical protein A2493_02075 [Candidatus Magasanikbacteria bacterium RIFOXYC12_FULL_33_11]
MKRKFLKFSLIIIVSLGILIAVPYFVVHFNRTAEEKAAQAIVDKQQEDIKEIISRRQLERTSVGDDEDPFGEDGIVRVLLIGLDSRAGQTAGHCDVIQMIEIDKNNNIVNITAIPRGTYSSLPPGKATTSTDYYVSNACGLAGLDYGINQIEKISGKKADYLVMVGFSETLGILRNLKLPTTETLQWLRQRQGYAIGEPQRARNHSTFIKQLLTKYLPDDHSKIDTAFHYILYKIIKTDLTFAESEKIVDALIDMDIKNNPDKISLSMRPSYNVLDIPYDPDTAGEYVKSMIDPVKGYLKGTSYTGITTEEADQRIVDTIDKKISDDEFVLWAYDNQLWLQIEDDIIREEKQYEITWKYLNQVSGEEQQLIVADYVLEMRYLGLEDWAVKGEDWIKAEITKN